MWGIVRTTLRPLGMSTTAACTLASLLFISLSIFERAAFVSGQAERESQTPLPDRIARHLREMARTHSYGTNGRSYGMMSRHVVPFSRRSGMTCLGMTTPHS